MTEQTVSEETGKALAREGKYLTFALGKEEYGVEILKVREIIKMLEVTSVPQVKNYIKGVVNLRGKVIPVISLRLKFGMEEVEDSEETCIVVINFQETLIGVVVDSVKEVVDIPAGNIEPTPNFGARVHSDYILGLGKIGEKVKILLNIDRVLSDDLEVASEIGN